LQVGWINAAFFRSMTDFQMIGLATPPLGAIIDLTNKRDNPCVGADLSRPGVGQGTYKYRFFGWPPEKTEMHLLMDQDSLK
jgi:hypothetical protein